MHREVVCTDYSVKCGWQLAGHKSSAHSRKSPRLDRISPEIAAIIYRSSPEFGINVLVLNSVTFLTLPARTAQTQSKPQASAPIF